jgi:hypothetical protein
MLVLPHAELHMVPDGLEPGYPAVVRMAVSVVPLLGGKNSPK